MSDSGTWIEIVLLAMLAGFIGLRLVSVLGKRTGSEKPVGEPFRPGATQVSAPVAGRIEAPSRGPVEIPAGTVADAASLQAVADADPQFAPAKFVTGAQAAYRMILEAFWAGDVAGMTPLVGDNVLDLFKRAIAQRTESGLTLANKLSRINGATIIAARMVGQMAEVTIRFDAEIVAAAKDAQGNVVEGSLTEPAPTHDVWTFSRHVGSPDPNWLLIDTDAEA